MEAILESVTNSLRSIGILLTLIAILMIVELALPFFKRRGGLKRNFINVALTLLYFGVNLVLTAATVGLAAYAEAAGFGLFANFDAPFWLVVLLALVALDLFSYISHVLMHKAPFLWRVHRVHHSDVHLDATTAFRQHPMEAMIRFMFTMAPALLLGLPAAAVAIYRLLSGVNAILEHVNISLWQPLDTALSLFYVTPNMHKVHHSRVQSETDSNYSNLFSVYDRLFGTFTPTARAKDVDYGLDNFAGATLNELLKSPFDREERVAPSPAPMALARL